MRAGNSELDALGLSIFKNSIQKLKDLNHTYRAVSFSIFVLFSKAGFSVPQFSGSSRTSWIRLHAFISSLNRVAVIDMNRKFSSIILMNIETAKRSDVLKSAKLDPEK